jgi:hypothetical protein
MLRISAIIDDIVQGVTISKSAGNAAIPNCTSGNNANSGDAALVVGLVDIVVNSIDEVSQAAGLAALPS